MDTDEGVGFLSNKYSTDEGSGISGAESRMLFFMGLINSKPKKWLNNILRESTLFITKMSKGTMAESLKESMELMYKDYRYNKAKVEKLYFNNHSRLS